MYRPDYSKTVDFKPSLDLVREFPLGLLISQSMACPEIPEANHYPFLLTDEGDTHSLISHMARANPQWKSLDKKRVSVHFLGPNSYISPVWYANKLNVPTWNYAAVCIQGTVEVIEEASGIEEILNRSVGHFEALNQTYWNYDLPEAFQSRLVSAIVGIKIKVESIEGKFKMSQNRNSEDYESVVTHLGSSKTASAQSLSHWMRRNP